LVATVGDGKRVRVRAIERVLKADRFLDRSLARPDADLSFPADWQPDFEMCPGSGVPESWTVRPMRTVGELAHWLRATPGELEWLADPRGWLRGEPPESRRAHYRYVWRRKPDGTWRLIESPKQRLKGIQRALLRAILDRIPAHDAAHGFCRERSILSSVQPHVAQRCLVKLDLRDFFASITRPRVLAVFLTAGYPEPVAEVLAGLCAHGTPRPVLRRWPDSREGVPAPATVRRFGIPHLPQGSPASPALANLVAFRMDCRLAGLARAVGAQYTRYADDLLFSGGPDFARGAGGCVARVGAIVMEEGFDVRWRKVRVMRPGVAQRAAGLVLNVRPNVPRRDYDQLKAILTNCIRHGPADQNRAGVPDSPAHLAGRVAHVARIHPDRGARLRRLLDRVCWD
jgi:GNAT superfamily N-acetyltransferase